jgi:alkylated DNA repair dioxygenase AlkB
VFDPDCFEYRPEFIPEPQAGAWLEQLRRELDWTQQEIMLFGRRVMQPRLVAWYGDPHATYTYSGLTLRPLPWHPVLAEIKDRLEAATRGCFNSVLANLYRDGADSMGWHSDDEPELGPAPLIASVSLGAERRFLVRPRKRAAGKKAASRGMTLGHGSLLVMKGRSQRLYQHALPRTRKPVVLRINLTYRQVDIPSDDQRMALSGRDAGGLPPE